MNIRVYDCFRRVKGWGKIGLKGLQIQCGALSGVPGGFDSHALPPEELTAPYLQIGHFKRA